MGSAETSIMNSRSRSPVTSSSSQLLVVPSVCRAGDFGFFAGGCARSSNNPCPCPNPRYTHIPIHLLGPTPLPVLGPEPGAEPVPEPEPEPEPERSTTPGAEHLSKPRASLALLASVGDTIICGGCVLSSGSDCLWKQPAIPMPH